MRIRIINSCSGVNFSFSAGDVVDAEPETAVELLRAGHASPAEEPPAGGPETAAIAAPENAAMRRGRPRKVSA